MLHPDIFASTDQDTPRAGLGFACHRERGSRNQPHSHWRAQLIYAITGSLRVVCPQGIWIVPPERAVWMPGNIEHQVVAVTEAEARFLYLDCDQFPDLPSQVTVVQMTPVMRECLLSFLTHPRLYDEAGSAPHLLAIIANELRSLPIMPLHLPKPDSAPLKQAARLVLTAPDSPPSLSAAAAAAALSPRSFERRFARETGLTWRKWVQQARLMEAVSRLSEGASVNEVAFALGYSGPSAFVAMFRTMTGVTPGRYFEAVSGG